MITGIVSWPLAAHSFSSVTPSVSGIQMSSNTRSGGSAWRIARAEAALSAVMTTWPSSARISERSSRIPISSSTTRMLAMAIGSNGRLAGRPGPSYPSEYDCHGCSGAPEAIDQLDPGIVFVDDFLHHRQSESRSTRLGGHVGLESAPKYIRRETGAIVLDRKTHGPPGRVEAGNRLVDHDRFRAYHDLAGAGPYRAGGLRARDRRLRVGHQIVDQLAQVRGVALDRGQVGRQPQLDPDRSAFSRAGPTRARLGPVQRSDLLHQRVQVQRRQLRRRQPRILAEFVDHALHRGDLIDDRGGAAHQHFGLIGRQLAGELHLQSLRRQLDRRQRILDLVRKAARDLAP